MKLSDVVSQGTTVSVERNQTYLERMKSDSRLRFTDFAILSGEKRYLKRTSRYSFGSLPHEDLNEGIPIFERMNNNKKFLDNYNTFVISAGTLALVCGVAYLLNGKG